MLHLSLVKLLVVHDSDKTLNNNKFLIFGTFILFLWQHHSKKKKDTSNILMCCLGTHACIGYTPTVPLSDHVFINVYVICPPQQGEPDDPDAGNRSPLQRSEQLIGDYVIIFSQEIIRHA